MSTVSAYDPSLPGERAPTILIIENEPSNRVILDLTLRAAHYSCIATDTVDEAWNHLQRSDINLVITDLHLFARADALSLIARMRANPHTARIPVIVTSGDRSQERRQAALAAGAGAYLVKPYEKGALLAHIRQCLADGEA